MQNVQIKYCSNCGHAVQYRIPTELHDSRLRAVCPNCHHVHYHNPLNVVGTIPVWGQQVLLCQRNIEPRLGRWTLPAGFMELGETVAQGAARETREETGAEFELGDLFSLVNVAKVGQVHFFYHCRLLSPHFLPGLETMQAQLFDEGAIPWDDIAFKTVSETLKRYFNDRRRGHFAIHIFDIH